MSSWLAEWCRARKYRYDGWCAWVRWRNSEHSFFSFLSLSLSFFCLRSVSFTYFFFSFSSVPLLPLFSLFRLRTHVHFFLKGTWCCSDTRSLGLKVLWYLLFLYITSVLFFFFVIPSLSYFFTLSSISSFSRLFHYSFPPLLFIPCIIFSIYIKISYHPFDRHHSFYSFCSPFH